MKFLLLILLLYLIVIRCYDYKADKQRTNKSLKQKEREWMREKIKGSDSFLL